MVLSQGFWMRVMQAEGPGAARGCIYVIWEGVSILYRYGNGYVYGTDGLRTVVF